MGVGRNPVQPLIRLSHIDQQRRVGGGSGCGIFRFDLGHGSLGWFLGERGNVALWVDPTEAGEQQGRWTKTGGGRNHQHGADKESEHEGPRADQVGESDAEENKTPGHEANDVIGLHN